MATSIIASTGPAQPGDALYSNTKKQLFAEVMARFETHQFDVKKAIEVDSTM